MNADGFDDLWDRVRPQFKLYSGIALSSRNQQQVKIWFQRLAVCFPQKNKLYRHMPGSAPTKQ
ncbi:MAG: hypothetical protein DMG30_19185 [Acidobacteria bacterium]|nr:MAG: hypothetical protein DMG30_19185 [Acidobacteriota bacterium]